MTIAIIDESVSGNGRQHQRQQQEPDFSSRHCTVAAASALAMYDTWMQMTFGAWVVVIGVVGAATYLLRILFKNGPAGRLEGGAVSQSWLTEHNSGKGERPS
jgi:hypothetical protein